MDMIIINEDGSSRFIVQLVAGISIVSMVVYNLFYMKRLKGIIGQWSFLLYWGIFIVLVSGYYVLSLAGLPTAYSVSQVRNVFVALFIFNAILFVYNATISDRLKDKTLWFLVILLTANALYDLGLAVIDPRIRYGGIEEINTSSGYVFVMILPLLMYLFKDYNKWVFALTLVLTLISGKRGAFVIYIILMGYMMLQHRNLKSENKFDWKSVLFAGIVIVGVFFFIEIAYESFIYRIQNIEKNDAIGSGRSIFWMILLNHWNDSNIVYKIIGSGYYSSRGIIQNVAHSDFLQYLVDYGIIGLSIWSMVLYKLYYNVKKVKDSHKFLYVLLIFCIIILIGRGLFAGTLRTDQIYLSISLGYLLGIYDLKCRSILIVLGSLSPQSGEKGTPSLDTN